ncbi:unnamed protein product [Gongylonema pulchrum]|uniref:Uncharacterized protein n=1 Tax=Gongylonema pulchrum TaxID=637853 RepID=A0A3P6Q9X9_9BILA|nr:unnamed protein product [Gongylonema pulchrum]
MQSASEEILLILEKALISRIEKEGIYKTAKILPVETDKQILNTYLDDEPDFTEQVVPNGNHTDMASIACYNRFGEPFPGFLCPLMKIMAHEYGGWRSKVKENLTCEDLLDLSTHPCDHNTSSCVLVALPNKHVLLGCMDDHTGKFVAPQEWARKFKVNQISWLDFRVENPLRLSQHCRQRKNGRPLCLRNNLFFREYPLVQQLTCCCKGHFCADALFDQVL